MKYADLTGSVKTAAEGVVMRRFAVGRGAAAKFLAEFSEYTINEIGSAKRGSPEYRKFFNQIIWGRLTDDEIHEICGTGLKGNSNQQLGGDTDGG